MDANVEKLFIQNYVIKRKRTRVLWEMNSDRHRSHCMFYLMSDYLDKTYFHQLEAIRTEDDIYNTLLSKKVSDHCYIMTAEKNESRYLSLMDAINFALSYESILYCPDSNIAFLYGEYGEYILLFKATPHKEL